MDSRNFRRRHEFWDACRRCAEENRVLPDRPVFYVKWVREFTGFLPGKRLKERTGKDIKSFLSDLVGREGIADYQVQQKGMMGCATLHPSYNPEFTCPLCSEFLGLHKE